MYNYSNVTDVIIVEYSNGVFFKLKTKDKEVLCLYKNGVFNVYESMLGEIIFDYFDLTHEEAVEYINEYIKKINNEKINRT